MNLALPQHSSEKIAPFLKWAGGKRWLASTLASDFKLVSGHYIEPFLGGGAIFFELQPPRSVLNDVNQDLINAYSAIKEDWQRVESLLHAHSRKHNKRYYYDIRAYVPRCKFQQAARFIYLNRTCWNGLYRVNLNGQFNVPKGTKDSVILNSDNWEATARLLQSSRLVCGDFQETIDQAKEGDLIFADPPYTVKHDLNGFIKYNESLFTWQDQERLCKALGNAVERGVRVISTNANHKSIRALYEGRFRIRSLVRPSVLSADPAFRGPCQELLIESH